MATPNTQPLWTDDRIEPESDEWLRDLAEDVPDSGGLPTSGTAWKPTPEIDALLDKLAAEGPVRGEPLK